jgi:hypothetical protein
MQEEAVFKTYVVLSLSKCLKSTGKTDIKQVTISGLFISKGAEKEVQEQTSTVFFGGIKEKLNNICKIYWNS